jgi:pimeloyl-ACP methyl ester carboxylesterase
MTTILFLPGFMCDARLFAAQMPILGTRGDPRCHVPNERTMARMAEAALDLYSGRLSLVGLSMGGILALEILARAPDRIERLALLDTTPLADAPANFDIRTRQIQEVHAGGMDRVMREELKPAYLVDSPVKSALLDLCMDMARNLGPAVFECQSEALRDRADRQNALIHAPPATLILCGAEDRLCPPERHDMMHRLAPHATRIDVPDAGHLPTLEQPTATTAALVEWIERDAV